MRRIKAAIIGAGFIGKVHIEALKRLAYVDVVAICQTSQQKALLDAKALDIPKAYGDFMELLQDEEIEVIHNCTPNHLHYEINKQALKHGKHLLSEKPLTMTIEEAKELYELAQVNKLVTGVNFNYRQFPMMQQLKSMVNDKAFGEIRIVRGHYLQDWLLYETDYNWRMEEQYGGGTRAISDIGSHLFDLAQYTAGLRITEIMADAAIIIPQRYRPAANAESDSVASPNPGVLVDITTEDYCSILVKFDNGSRGVFTVSQVSAGNKNALEIHLDGSLASASWMQEEPSSLHIGFRDKPGERITRDPNLLNPTVLPFLHYPSGHEEGWPDSLKNMMLQFYECIRNQNPLSNSVATFKDGYQIMLINDAIVKSLARGGWVEVEVI